MRYDLLKLDRALTPQERKRLKVTSKAGHAAPPGTGPQGETCRSCQHLERMRYAKTYFKCALNKAKWTHGSKTDIKAGDPSCQKWERKPES